MGAEFWIGILILAATVWDLSRDETDTVFVLDIFPWFDISRKSFPVIYWIIIITQAGIGLTMVFNGIFS